MDEIGALKHEEVLSDALTCHREFSGQRACRRFAALEQQVEQSQPRRIAERRPQPIGIPDVLRHRLWREVVTRAA